jgi:hypothetical protein
MHLIAARMGWTLDRTEDLLSPVVAQSRIVTESLTIEAGQAAGVQQIGRGFAGTEEKITLSFRASGRHQRGRGHLRHHAERHSTTARRRNGAKDHGRYPADLLFLRNIFLIPALHEEAARLTLPRAP